MVGLEALACGRPVITTNVGDCRKLALEPWMVVEPADSRALSNALTQFSELPVERKFGLRVRAHQLAKSNFSIDDAAASYIRLYERIGAQS